jgi:hypothetical protein
MRELQEWAAGTGRTLLKVVKSDPAKQREYHFFYPQGDDKRAGATPLGNRQRPFS